jgi:hypothetical protein
MKVLELAEGVSTVKIRSIKKQGQLVYDGDPRQYEWKPSTIKNWFDQINTLLGKQGRRFDRLIITKYFNERWFLAISHGTPEVVYYYFYNAHGRNSFVYIDWSKYKTEEFLALPPDKQIELLSTAVKANIADIWKKERSIDTIGAALETMDKAEADTAIDALGSKFLSNISKMEADAESVLKLAQFVHYLDKIATPKAKKLATLAIGTFKDAAIADLAKEIKFGPAAVMNKAIWLKKAGFDWPELDNIVENLKDDFIKYMLKEIKSTGGSHPNIILNWIKTIKDSGHKWPELDIIEKSLRVGKQIK